MNTINNLSPSFRDKLLSKNLIFGNSVLNHYISQYGNGLGYPVTISSGDGSVIESPLLEDIGVNFRENNILKNKYIPIDFNQKIGFDNSLYNNFDSIVGGYYLDGKIQGYNDFSTESGILNLLSGNNYFSYGTSLASKLLQVVTNKNDTALGVIGKEALMEQMKYRTAQNLSNEIIGSINLDVSSLLSGDSFFKDDFRITKASTFMGRVADKAMDLIGLQLPSDGLFNSGLNASASIFNYDLPNELHEGFYNTNDRNTQLLKNTGRGHQKVLFSNFSANFDSKLNGGGERYAPDYDYKSINIDFEGNEYVKYDSSGRLSYGFEEHSGNTLAPNDREVTDTFTWVPTQDEGVNYPQITEGNSDGGRRYYTPPKSDVVFNDKKTLLGKTQNLFNSGKIKSLINNKGMFYSPDNMVTTEGQNKSGYEMISKGSNVMYVERVTKNSSDNPNEVFCRAWVGSDGYDSVNKLQKHRGLDKNGGNRNNNTSSSVLDDNGFVKIAPYKDDYGFDTLNTDPKKFMFSLENLAWCRNLDSLPNWEIGNGDPVTGTKGRIMWFPPYDLQFSENTGVNIDTHNFIGRGEPVYTYNSTERTGNLSFKVIIDHPEWINNPELFKEYEYVFDDLFNSLMSGCGVLPEYFSGALTQDELNELEVATSDTPTIIPVDAETPPDSFKIYFPNDVTSLGNIPNSIEQYMVDIDGVLNEAEVSDESKKYLIYESSGSRTQPEQTRWNTNVDGVRFITGEGVRYSDEYNYGLNAGWRNSEFLNELKDKLKNDCPSCKINITGFASMDKVPTNGEEHNDYLSEARAEEVKKLFTNLILDPTDDLSNRFGGSDENVSGKGETGSNAIYEATDHINKKEARYVLVSFEPNMVNDDMMDEIIIPSTNKRGTFNSKIKGRFYNESLHFEKLKQEDKITYKKISERIKYFQPAFHSITPEGFNSRLTFLNQCTRQGSTVNDSDRPDNMVFGAPPICILRIGDFYNTKIMIETMSIDYEGLWDLNPEGVGVQPMIANVSLSFKFLGGSSMQGAINRLQNALSFNYYANTEIFEPRAHSIVRNANNATAEYIQEATDIQTELYGAKYNDRYIE